MKSLTYFVGPHFIGLSAAFGKLHKQLKKFRETHAKSDKYPDITFIPEHVTWLGWPYNERTVEHPYVVDLNYPVESDPNIIMRNAACTTEIYGRVCNPIPSAYYKSDFDADIGVMFGHFPDIKSHFQDIKNLTEELEVVILDAGESTITDNIDDINRGLKPDGGYARFIIDMILEDQMFRDQYYKYWSEKNTDRSQQDTEFEAMLRGDDTSQTLLKDVRIFGFTPRGDVYREICDMLIETYQEYEDRAYGYNDIHEVFGLHNCIDTI